MKRAQLVFLLATLVGCLIPCPNVRSASSGSVSDAPTTEPSSTLRNLDTDVSNYADRAAPLLPSTLSDQQETVLGAPDVALLPTKTVATTAPAVPTTQPTTMGAPPAAESKNEWIIAPLPNHNPEFGWGIVGRAAYIFSLDPNDKISPPSTIGLGGYYSENHTWFAGLFGRFFIDEDRYRVIAGLMHAEVNYNFSGVGTAAGESGNSIPLSQQMNGGMGECLFRIAPGFYLGPKYVGANVHISVDTSDLNSPMGIPANEVNTTMSGLGVHAQWDTRDSVFYPRKGYLADVEADFHDPAIGDSFAYQVYQASYNQYVGLSERQVLAFRIMGRFESGDVPFYALSQFGRGSDLRGYKFGQYQDKQMFAGQVEYRLEITRRLGAVAFAGVGEVANSIGEMTFEDLLPAGGIGVRYVLAEKNHVAIRFDYAWGRNGSQYYLTVGEAF
ncbi:MAG TPA: BamA/TamA family outer membrane protein [Tepidisphaeraceae bacterium]|jgi:hypothetical protein|nr:BamA/TamA family outer membrane protein [Tepidisphaeraceae bacterium]